MPSYEYRTEVLTHGFMGRKEDDWTAQSSTSG